MCNIQKMKLYSTEPRDCIFMKEYVFLPFVKNKGKSLSDKYSQKLRNPAKQSATDTLKTTSKRAIQQTAEATGDLNGNKIDDEIKNSESQSNPETALQIEENTKE